MDPPAAMPGDLYQQICESSTDGIWVVDADARTSYVNARLAEMLGYTPQEMIGRSLYDFLFPEDHERLREKLRRRRRGIREQHECRYRRKCGKEVRVLMGANPLFDATGDFRGVVAIITDITDRYVQERQREDSREALRSLFEYNPDTVYVLDMDGRLKDVNAAGSRLTGYSREELLSLSWQPITAAEDLPRALESFEEAKAGAASSFEITLIHKDGHPVPIAGTSFPLKVHGVIAGVYGVARDISARKRMEESLHFVARASQSLVSSLNYRETLERTARLAVPVLGEWCIVAAASEGECTEVSTAASDPTVDFRLRELHELCPDLLSPDSPLARLATGTEAEIFPLVDASLLTAIAGHPTAEAMLQSLHPGSLLAAPLRDHGRRRGLLLIGRRQEAPAFTRDHCSLAQDLAHLAAVALENAHLHQELRRADNNKDHFLATLAHELRNPLSAIRSGVEVLMRAGTDTPRGRRALETIERQVRHEARLLDDLLNVSRIAKGKVLLRFEPVELTRLLRSTLDDNMDALEESGLQLELHLPEEAVWVRGDPTRLAQAFANLLNNAVKFTDCGGTIRVRLQLTADRHWGSVLVEDTGIGIEPGLLRHLFETFAQGEHSRERSRGGLGLGLALVKGLVEIHGGEVRATSDGPGRGACFSFTLPLTPAPEAAEQTTSAPTTPPPTVATQRVLIVDDNRAVAESMSDLLQMMGYEVDVAFSGPEGIRAAHEFRPHAVLCDLGLPGLDGYEVARQLRADTATAKSRLIALTGAGTGESVSQALEAGFDYYLLKPVEPADIQRLLTAADAEAA